MPPATADKPNGQARRRARTRGALLAAGRRLLAEGRPQASIEEITKRAGVGFGSFFNHFPGGKDELYREAVLESLDAYATWLTEVTEGVADPAETFARSFRLTGRLAAADSEAFAPLLGRGTEILSAATGLRPTALRDIRAGMVSGRFTTADAETTYMLAGGMLLALLQRLNDVPPDEVEAVIDDTSAAALRMLGVDPEEAQSISRRDLPNLPEHAAWI